VHKTGSQFSLDNFKVEDSTIKPVAVQSKRIKGAFLKGPIPWNWLTGVMQMKGKELHIAMLLWQEAGFRKSRTVKLSMKRVDELGFSRWTARRALKSMEKAGFVRVEGGPGKLKRVEILDLD
jgi:hypothetical protein